MSGIQGNKNGGRGSQWCSIYGLEILIFLRDSIVLNNVWPNLLQMLSSKLIFILYLYWEKRKSRHVSNWLWSHRRASFDRGSDRTKPMDILLSIAHSHPQTTFWGSLHVHFKRRRGAGKMIQFTVSSPLSLITSFTYLELLLNLLLS